MVLARNAHERYPLAAIAIAIATGVPEVQDAITVRRHPIEMRPARSGEPDPEKES